VVIDTGGAISCERPSFLSISDSIFESNLADYGGGLFLIVIATTPLQLNNILFMNNGASQEGGGFCIEGTASSNTTTIKNIIFQENHATNGGGGYFAGIGDLKLVDIVFENNNAKTGGGWYCMTTNSVSNVTIISQNVLFEDNIATSNCLDNDVGGSCKGSFSSCASNTPVKNCTRDCEGGNCVMSSEGAHCFTGSRSQMDSCLCTSSPSTSPTGLIVGLVLGGIGLIILIGVIAYYCRTKTDYQKIIT